MRRFVEGADRSQSTLFPQYLEDWIGEDNPVRVIDVFVDELDLAELGFGGVEPEVTGRPSYHPSVLLKLYASSDPPANRVRILPRESNAAARFYTTRVKTRKARTEHMLSGLPPIADIGRQDRQPGDRTGNHETD